MPATSRIKKIFMGRFTACASAYSVLGFVQLPTMVFIQLEAINIQYGQ